ncbi:unnamed protein product [marine sediment metagenome]|uniref:MoaD/ThiS family protein n=1 Tax=marine sediment metagenome TaxID=412755 RepID=X1AZL9_9ZZZZ
MIMKVEILYFADFKDITGKDREFLELKENTVEGLTSEILSKYNPLKNLIWDEEIKKLKGNISIVINDKLITDKNKGETELIDGDKVAFLLPFAGG